jgi:hypothetical protein
MSRGGGGTLVHTTAEAEQKQPVKQSDEPEKPPVLKVESNMEVVISRPGAPTPGALGRLLGPVAMRTLSDETAGFERVLGAIHTVASLTAPQ